MTEPAPTRLAILDDHQSFAEALSLALSAFPDLECVGVASSIGELVELGLEHRPDVLLLDYQLRDGDALDCAAQLADAGVEARLILITAHVLPNIRARALANGFERVLGKDVKLDAIAGAVRMPALDVGDALTDGFEPIQFSRRQREVLDLMGQGLDPASIAEALFISIHTARTHVKDVLKLLEAPSQLAAVTRAIREGYLLPPSPRDPNQRDGS